MPLATSEDSGTDSYLPGSSLSEEEWRDISTVHGSSPGGTGVGAQDPGTDTPFGDWMIATSEDLGLDDPNGAVIEDANLPNVPGTDGDGDGIDFDGDGEGIGDEGLGDLGGALGLPDVPWKIAGAAVGIGIMLWLLRPYAGLADSAT